MEKDNEKQEIFSERVRAGKRTYFFDVKATRANDYYLTITESKRRYKEDGFVYEKHKIFLYKEDFDKFVSALNITVNHVKEELMPEIDFSQFERKEENAGENKTVKSKESKESKESEESEESEESIEAETSGTGIDTELKWD